MDLTKRAFGRFVFFLSCYGLEGPNFSKELLAQVNTPQNMNYRCISYCVRFSLQQTVINCWNEFPPGRRNSGHVARFCISRFWPSVAVHLHLALPQESLMHGICLKLKIILSSSRLILYSEIFREKSVQKSFMTTCTESRSKS